MQYDLDNDDQEQTVELLRRLRAEAVIELAALQRKLARGEVERMKAKLEV
jgi:hypothetical protein